MTRETNSNIFYGYIIVIVSSLILIIMHGIASSYGVFFSSLQNEFQADRATISGIGALAFFMEGVYSVPLGKLTDRLGPRVVIAASGVLLGVGYFLMSRSGALWQLYLFYPFIAAIGIASGNVSLLSTVTRWFVKRRGLMTSIVKVGTGAGIFIMPLVASWLISGYGWRNAYVILSIIGLIGIVSTAQLLRRDPGQMGLTPYGLRDADGAFSKLAIVAQLSLKETMRTRQFWAVCAAYFFVLYTAQSVMIHIVAHAIDSNIEVTRAASIVSVIGGISIAGRLAMGGIGDHFGNKRALMISFIIFFIALSWLQFAQGLWMLYLFAVVYGFAHGGFFAIMSPLIGELFGTASHGVTFGMMLFLSQIGGAFGPVVTGRIFDVTGSYRLAFLILLAMTIAALILTATQVNPIKNSSQK